MLNLLVGLGIGVALGGLIGWLWAARRNAAATTGADSQPLIDELRSRITTSQTELTEVRAQLTDVKTKIATAEAEREAARQLLESQRELNDKAAREARVAQDRSLHDLREAFRALSAEALQKTQPEFLRLANETLAKFQESAKGDLKERQQAIATLVEPLKQHLETYQKRLQQAEVSQSTTLGEVKKQLETLAQQSQSLSTETFQLRKVLSSNQARGRWGEETLRRVVESAGMSAHCDFSEQMQAGDGKPDLVVRLPGERVIIVDSKVPDLDFLVATDAVDTTRRAEALAQHAAKLKGTIKALADRDYPSQFENALDYVVLFLPAESLFSAALEGDHELMTWAQNKRIIIATPCSLIAILRSVSLSWQQHKQTENARLIAEAAQELFTRVVKFTEHFERIRAGLERTNGAFNDAVASYESRVQPGGLRLLELGGTDAAKELAEVRPLETTLRLAPTNDERRDGEKRLIQ
jgi:DNA recombination protein RmuC